MFDTLGKTPDEVAATLRAHGIQGVQNTIRRLNPIVRYAYTQLPEVRSAWLAEQALTITFEDGRTEQQPVPPPVQDFLTAFDKGDYPELLLPHA